MSTDNGLPLHTNRLIHEKFPYLLQHAHNPVNWYPWGPEAFQKAARQARLSLHRLFVALRGYE